MGAEPVWVDGSSPVLVSVLGRAGFRESPITTINNHNLDLLGFTTDGWDATRHRTPLHLILNIGNSVYSHYSEYPAKMASPNPSRAAALDVLIVGGGPCGLAAAISVALAGHKATVCEASERENQLGSGVQIAPNATRLLSRWGLHDVLGQVASVPRLLEIRHLNGDPVVRREAYEREIIDQFGFPFWTTHRVDLQAGLIRRATELGVQIQYSSRVTKVDSTGPFIELRNGERYHGDLILIADGATSTLRPQVLRTPTMGRPTSDMAYRLTIDRAKVHDQELLDFMDLPQIRIWTGPGSLAVGYPLKEGTQLTVLIITAVTGCQDRTSMSAVIGELKGLLKDWDPM